MCIVISATWLQNFEDVLQIFENSKDMQCPMDLQAILPTQLALRCQCKCAVIPACLEVSGMC